MPGIEALCLVGARYRQLGAIVCCVVGVINGNAASNREADAEQAEYFRQEISALRAQAQADLARHYIELQQSQNSGLIARAAEVRKFIRALEYEVATLERLGEGLNRWL